MKGFLVIPLVTLTLAFAGLAHEHDHADQMPLNYVKYPYQAVYYPGDNDGELVGCSKIHQEVDSFGISDRRLRLFWHYHICEVTVGPMPRQR